MRWILFSVIGLSMGMAQDFNFEMLSLDRSKSNIPVAQVLAGGPPPQGIPALGFSGDRTGQVEPSPAAKLISLAEARWLASEEPVVVTVLKEARAYPLQILMWHEIANDTLNGVPIAVTFCPLCNSALTFDRRIPLTEAQRQEVLKINPKAKVARVDAAFQKAYKEQEGKDMQWGLEVTFGTSGLLYNSNLLMFDSATNTLFSQILGEGNVGTLTGVKLLRYPAQIVSFGEFRSSFPSAMVLSRDTGFRRSYGQNPYLGYDQVDEPAFLFRGPKDGRLPPKERVVAVELESETVAYPFSALVKDRLLQDKVGKTPIVVWWQAGTRSALDTSSIINGKDIGAVGVFKRELDGRVLNFKLEGKGFVDEETKSRWNLLGQAIDGPLKGKTLEPIVHDNTLWFAWAAFKPKTRVFGLR